MALVMGEVKPGFACDAAGNPQPDLVRNATVVLLPPVWDPDPEIGWGRVFYAFGCDFGTVTLRVAVHNSAPGHAPTWRLSTITLNSADPVTRIDSWAGDDRISICRVPTSATDTADSVPVGYRVEAVLRA